MFVNHNPTNYFPNYENNIQITVPQHLTDQYGQKCQEAVQELRSHPLTKHPIVTSSEEIEHGSLMAEIILNDPKLHSQLNADQLCVLGVKYPRAAEVLLKQSEFTGTIGKLGAKHIVELGSCHLTAAKTIVSSINLQDTLNDVNVLFGGGLLGSSTLLAADKIFVGEGEHGYYALINIHPENCTQLVQLVHTHVKIAAQFQGQKNSVALFNEFKSLYWGSKVE